MVDAFGKIFDFLKIEKSIFFQKSILIFFFEKKFDFSIFLWETDKLTVSKSTVFFLQNALKLSKN